MLDVHGVTSLKAVTGRKACTHLPIPAHKIAHYMWWTCLSRQSRQCLYIPMVQRTDSKVETFGKSAWHILSLLHNEHFIPFTVVCDHGIKADECVFVSGADDIGLCSIEVPQIIPGEYIPASLELFPCN